MELGNFLGKLKGEEAVSPKQFLALILTDEVVQAAIWQVSGEQTEIISLGTPVEWDGETGTTSELVTAVDATISSASEGTDVDLDSVILGLPHSWTDKHGIQGVKRDFIGKICKELELKPLGFVEITDSVISYLKMQEGTPTTSILIEVSRDEFTLVLVRLGRIESIEVIGRSDDAVEDVREGIARFKIIDNLPSRIILFNSMHNLDDLIQTLLDVDWQSEFNFLHTPKIESLAKDIAIRSLSVAGGAEVARSLGLNVTDSVIQGELEPGSVLEPDGELESEPSDSQIDSNDDNLLSAADVGFGEFGTQLSQEIGDIEEVADDVPVEPAPVSHSQSRPPIKLPKLTLPTLKLPEIKLPHIHFSGQKTVLISAIIVLCLGLFSVFWFVPKAVLTISVVPKTLTQSVALTLATNLDTVNFQDHLVPTKIDKISVSGEQIAETTGKKIIGDPAKGEVTIYNRTSSPKTFAKGTELSVGSLKFSLDSDVQVASKSAGSDYVDVPGKSTAQLTAKSIGEESNLSSGREFVIASFSKDSYVAKNDKDFAGGSSQEVQVASKDDQLALSKDLTSKLLEQLTQKSKSSSSAGEGVFLLPDSVTSSDVSYSVKPGETAKTINLSMTLTSTILRYQTQDVTNLVNSAIDEAVPAGFIRANLPSSVELGSTTVDKDSTKVEGDAVVTVSLLPVLDKQKIQSSLRGKATSAVESILRQQVPGYSKAAITYLPRLIPTRLVGMPYNPSNISIVITPNPL